MTRLPPPVPKACSDCPWRTKDAVPGHLGPHSPLEWIRIAHSDKAVACHQTIVTEEGETEGRWEHPKMRQCRGIAQFRANVSKAPRDPEVETGPADKVNVFADHDEFLAYHGGETPMAPLDLYGPMEGEEKDA